VAGRALWRAVVSDYLLQDHQLLTLRSACECADRAEQAKAEVERAGVLIAGRFGHKKNPAVDVELAARKQTAALLRELALIDESEAEAPRPPVIAGRYRATGA
jgi:phage terminase small subunit